MVERIRKLCKQNGTSITKLEVQLGFGNGAIGKWKKAKAPYDRLQMVAAALGVTVDELVGGADEGVADAITAGAGNKKTALADEDGLTAAQAAIVDMLVQLTPEDELRAAAYIQALLDARAEPPAGRE